MIAAHGAQDLAIGECDAMEPTFMRQPPPRRRSAAVASGNAGLERVGWRTDGIAVPCQSHVASRPCELLGEGRSRSRSASV